MYLCKWKYFVQQHIIVGCMSCLKAVMLLLLYTEIQKVTFGCMDNNNAQMSNQINTKIVSCKSTILLIYPTGKICSMCIEFASIAHQVGS